MFARAVETASAFTFPYVGLRKRADGRVYSVVASFVVLNAEGWIATSAHILEEILASRQSAMMQEDGGVVRHLWDQVTQQTEIWAAPGFETTKPQLMGGRVNRAADLAIGRLEPFDSSAVAGLPVLRDCAASPVAQGESVCRLGFPFHNIDATFDDSRREFHLAEGSFPVPRFALDGMVARFNLRRIEDGSVGSFIETSTPGLRGQSGGPLLDAAGRIMGIQSQTAHLDLGFDARYAGADGEPITERQFLNVGLASHIDELRGLMDAEQASYRLG